jgi:hypothetical protein
MIELVFSACLIAAPTECKEVHLTYQAQEVSLMECFLYGQSEMAQWTNVHPQYRVGRFKCAPIRMAGTEI